MKIQHILYFIHVPWKWIKQRPHFVAEELSQKYEVVVAEIMPLQSSFRSAGNQTVKLRSYFQLPMDRMPVVHLVNMLLLRLQLGDCIRRSEMMWFTSPYQYSFFKKKNLKGKIIYDCMDDLLEFEPTMKCRQKLELKEKKLYKDADVVIVSSMYLREKLFKRYGKREVHVVNNAIKIMENNNLKPLPEVVKEKMPAEGFIISYIGTIEKWIDFQVVKEIVGRCPKVVFCFWGPLKTVLPQHDRIRYCGIVPHDIVFSVMERSNALIMPFVLNELILSVNPVKLYEYIYSGKPCLAPRYGESESFEEFVYLYDSTDECCQIIKQLLGGQGAKHSREECRAFAMANTWGERVEQIEKLLQ